MDKVIVLSAGASSRFWPLSSSHHKAFYRVGIGKTILEETISDILSENPDVEKIDLVVSPRDLELARELFKSQTQIQVIVQEEPKGEGDGVLKALTGDNFSGSFFLTTGDKINAGKILKKMRGVGESIALRTTNAPVHFGIVELDSENNIRSVVEKPEPGSAPSNQKITSAYILDAGFLPFLEKYAAEHYSLELALNEYVGGRQVKGVFVDEIEETRLKFPWDLLDINKKVQAARDLSFVHESAEVSSTALISGPVFIDRGVKILDFVKIAGPVYIGENTIIGDFSLVRNNSLVDKDVVIGAHSEIKCSIIYEGSTVHRSYIGDSVIDKNARIGGGVVIANKRYDRENVKSIIKGEKLDSGLRSFGAILGEGASMGTNSTIMPGVKLGKKSVAWPGKVVLEDLLDEETLK